MLGDEIDWKLECNSDRFFLWKFFPLLARGRDRLETHIQRLVVLQRYGYPLLTRGRDRLET
ncbi:hypothetical protein [Pseudanabaena sp. ABRG5-3]|uniref:hypothetical protein n=1 Tax=Pseudanabaena sp. ABRG5-3 TaxID=685565 RepID=UPI000F82C575|nr:hypothetical protein [Pseudanabaena sp. ABRG5-3]